MKILFEHQGARFACDLSKGKSLAIDLDFDGPQPNHFGAARAVRKPLRLGAFVGRTSGGGSCNVDDVSIVPHCNGTHTETVAHIVDDEVFVCQAVKPEPVLAWLISATPVAADETRETYRPPLEKTDRVITAAEIRPKLGGARECDALIVRTLPNPQTKKSWIYSSDQPPAFFTVEAMEAIIDAGVKHLLVDIPSVDRIYDEGKLTNHHLFWNVAEQSHRLAAGSWPDKTISEMIFVPDEIQDGVYLLSIQVPAFCSDAAPSRPIVYHIEKVSENGP
jgi:kynurenine formamidase